MIHFKCKYPGCKHEDIMEELPDACPKCNNKMFQWSHTEERRFLSPVRESYALGCNPDEIPRFQKKWPWMKFTPDGRCITESYTERKRVLKARGFADLQ